MSQMQESSDPIQLLLIGRKRMKKRRGMNKSWFYTTRTMTTETADIKIT